MSRAARILAALILLCAGSAWAETRGNVTGLPLPRFVSIKNNEAYARRGPSRSHRIDWIYRRAGLPVEITDEFGNWRKVRDADGQGGWMHYALLSGRRGVLVQQDVMLRRRPDPASAEIAQFNEGVVARVLSCGRAWCRLRKDGHRGWAPKSALWGVGPDEEFE